MSYKGRTWKVFEHPDGIYFIDSEAKPGQYPSRLGRTVSKEAGDDLVAILNAWEDDWPVMPPLPGTPDPDPGLTETSSELQLRPSGFEFENDYAAELAETLLMQMVGGVMLDVAPEVFSEEAEKLCRAAWHLARTFIAVGAEDE